MSKPTVTRYRAGQVPKFAQDNDDDNDIKPIKQAKKTDIKIDTSKERRRDRDDGESQSRRRHRDIQEAEIISEGTEQRKPSREEHRRVEAQVVPAAEEPDEEDEDNESRRARIRERARQRQIEEASIITDNAEEEEEEEEEEDSNRSRVRKPIKATVEEIKPQQEEESEEEEEEEESEEEESEEERPMIVPVFKKKSERDTLTEQQKQEELDAALAREKEKRLEERTQETKQMLEEELSKGNAAEDNAIEQEDDSEDEGDEAEEYELWKLRELSRIKRDREEREKIEQEKQEVEKRRNLTDKEIMELDKEILKPKEKAKWNYMQKYYHAGAFFRTFDEKDELSNGKKWDFNQPTLEDKVDKTILPSVMQVKNFGKIGRTKYTHLKDQDTTQWDAGWAAKDTMAIRQKLQKRMGGYSDIVPQKKSRN